MRTRGRLAARGVIVAIALAGPFQAAPALAATVERDDVDSADVSYLAAPGEANRIVVRAEADGIRFTDTGAVLSTASCIQVHAHEVFCPGIAETLIVEAGDGDDTLDVSAPRALAAGGPGEDLLVGAALSGGPGDDELRGVAAAGKLHGGTGDDELVAGPRGDELVGGAGNDTLVGGAGRDVLAGGEADCAGCGAPARDDDVVRGGPGADVLRIDGGRDRLDGEAGSDAYVVGASATGVAATIADTGGDARDSITLACPGVRLTASAGLRERTGRYALPRGSIAFSGLDGPLPCSVRAVPDVVGLPLAVARRALVAAGFTVGPVTYRRSARVARGRVISQRARRARAGSAVALVVSAGRA